MRCLRNYIRFSGRAQRSEFWWFVGIVLIFSFLLDQAILTSWDFGYDRLSDGLDWLFIAFALLVFLPVLAVTMRRFQDVGLPGWLAPSLWALGFALQMWAETRQALQIVTSETRLRHRRIFASTRFISRFWASRLPSFLPRSPFAHGARNPAPTNTVLTQSR